MAQPPKNSTTPPHLVRIDIPDVSPGQKTRVLPHDLEARHPTRKDRHPKADGDRSDNVPRDIPAGERPLHGGHDRRERRFVKP